MRRQRIADVILSYLSKSEGEGSRGGHIIGHTKSGKAVYSHQAAGYHGYHSFSRQDHKDAASLHGDAYMGGHREFFDALNAKKTADGPALKSYLSDKMKSADDTRRHHLDMSESHLAVVAFGDPIGKTTSGKPIYPGGAKRSEHHNFTPQDHLDAALLHHNLGSRSASTRDDCQAAVTRTERSDPDHLTTWQDRLKHHTAKALEHEKHESDHLRAANSLITKADHHR